MATTHNLVKLHQHFIQPAESLRAARRPVRSHHRQPGPEALCDSLTRKR
jgi:hypothetical protein